MGFLGWLFGTRSRAAANDSHTFTHKDTLDAQIFHLIRQQLLASGIPATAVVQVEGWRLITFDRRLAITVDANMLAEDKIHAHIVSWLPNPSALRGADELDACVMGIGPPESAAEQVAELWLRLVGAPCRACPRGLN